MNEDHSIPEDSSLWVNISVNIGLNNCVWSMFIKFCNGFKTRNYISKIILPFTVTWLWKLIPSQIVPFPEYPLLQIHAKDPSVFVQ